RGSRPGAAEMGAIFSRSIERAPAPPRRRFGLQIAAHDVLELLARINAIIIVILKRLLVRWLHRGQSRALVRGARLGAVLGKRHETQKTHLIGGGLPIGPAGVTLFVLFCRRIGERHSHHDGLDFRQPILAEGVELVVGFERGDLGDNGGGGLIQAHQCRLVLRPRRATRFSFYIVVGHWFICRFHFFFWYILFIR